MFFIAAYNIFQVYCYLENILENKAFVIEIVVIVSTRVSLIDNYLKISCTDYVGFSFISSIYNEHICTNIIWWETSEDRT